MEDLPRLLSTPPPRVTNSTSRILLAATFAILLLAANLPAASAVGTRHVVALRDPRTAALTRLRPDQMDVSSNETAAIDGGVAIRARKVSGEAARERIMAQLKTVPRQPRTDGMLLFLFIINGMGFLTKTNKSIRPSA